jgi:hypothetical protein
MLGKTTLVAIVVALTAISASADSVVVDWTGGGDYTTIQDGINAVSTGDTILVAPGTYMGEPNRQLNLGGREITLMLTGGRDVTTIDPQHEANAFWIGTTQTSATVISGFTIQNGLAQKGGAIYLHSNSSPTIMDCRIVACEATQSTDGAGGISCYGGSPTLIDVVFSANRAYFGGALLTHHGSLPTLTNVRFEGNQSYRRGGAWYHEGSGSDQVTLTDCTFYNNVCTNNTGGGAMFISNTDAVITGTTFAWNRSPNAGAIRLATSEGQPIPPSRTASSRSVPPARPCTPPAEAIQRAVDASSTGTRAVTSS